MGVKNPNHPNTHPNQPTETNFIDDDLDSDDHPDCYYEPLNPDDEIAFNYWTQIESGEYKEGEITVRQPTPEDWKAFELALAQLKELAAREGVPLLPNPLAGTLKRPPIRSP